MVFARAVAVAIKARDGRTVLLQSRGLDLQLAAQAATEAMVVLQSGSQATDHWDIQSVGSQGPPLLCGRVEVMHQRLSVTYRVVGQLVFLLVAPPSANAFAGVSMLGEVVRVCVEGRGGGLEASAERLQRRFGEVYLAVDTLLGSGGVVGAPEALARAQMTLDALHDKERGGKAGPPAPEAPKPQAQRGRRRTLQAALDELTSLSFNTGTAMAGVKPRPGFALAADAPPAAARGPAPDPFAPGVPLPSVQSSDPFGDDDVFGLGKKAAAAAAAKPALPPGADPNDPFAASAAVPLAATASAAAAAAAAAAKAQEQKPDNWMDFDGAGGAKAAELGFEDSAFGPGAAAAPPPPPKPAEPVLRLSEVWRGAAAGGRLVQCGLTGRVEWVAEAAKAKVHTVQFLVMVPEGAPSGPLHAALSAARRHPACCRAGPGGGLLVADGIASKPHVGAPLLLYHLPPAACAPPIQAHLGTSSQPTPDGGRLVTLGVTVALRKDVPSRSAGLTVELSVPALLDRPLRAAPPGATFDASARLLRWHVTDGQQLAEAAGGGGEPFVAAFLLPPAAVAGGEAGVAAALARAAAKLVLRGAEGGAGGGSLSGAALAQGVAELEATPALCGWAAELDVAAQA